MTPSDDERAMRAAAIISAAALLGALIGLGLIVAALGPRFS